MFDVALRLALLFCGVTSIGTIFGGLTDNIIIAGISAAVATIVAVIIAVVYKSRTGETLIRFGK